MGPVTKAVNVLQGVSDIRMGWPRATITTLIFKLEKTRVSLTFSGLLDDALRDSLEKSLGRVFFGPRTTDDDVLKLGNKTTTSRRSIVSFLIWIF